MYTDKDKDVTTPSPAATMTAQPKAAAKFSTNLAGPKLSAVKKVLSKTIKVIGFAIPDPPSKIEELGITDKKDESLSTSKVSQ